uniref:Translocating chain-associated membrane protein n=1 Tax=Steinernema glaseri TaxID=37863 RepID=A0A1I8A3K2_9BILA
MGVDRRIAAAAGSRGKKSSPPIMSHEFVIQNHGDIMSCLLMVIVIGFMFNYTAPLANVFVLPQYNETVSVPAEAVPQTFYRNGPLDMCVFFFYTVAWITMHAVIQEYVLDKLQRKLHLSKTRMSKFNESGHLFFFSVYSAIHAGYLIYDMDLIANPLKLWIGYPQEHRYMSVNLKLFFILQISHWIHQFPEFYFQKVKRDEISQRSTYSAVYLFFITAAYFFNFNRLALVLLFIDYFTQSIFHVTRMLHFSGKNKYTANGFVMWNGLFVLTRVLSAGAAVVVLWYGLRINETPFVDIKEGNFNTAFIRLNSLLCVLVLQVFMLWNFGLFHVTRMRERAAKAKPDQVKPKEAQKKNNKKNANEFKNKAKVQ